MINAKNLLRIDAIGALFSCFFYWGTNDSISVFHWITPFGLDNTGPAGHIILPAFFIRLFPISKVFQHASQAGDHCQFALCTTLDWCISDLYRTHVAHWESLFYRRALDSEYFDNFRMEIRPKLK